MSRIPYPGPHEYAPFYATYIEKVPEGDLPASLQAQEPGFDIGDVSEFEPAIFKDQAGGLPEPGSPDTIKKVKWFDDKNTVDKISKNILRYLKLC